MSWIFASFFYCCIGCFFVASTHFNKIRSLLFYYSKSSIDILQVFTTRRGVLRFYRFYDSKRSIEILQVFYDSKRGIEILQVFKTRRGVLRFYRFLRLEEEYWNSRSFLAESKIRPWLEFWLLPVQAFNSIFDCWLQFPIIGLWFLNVTNVRYVGY